MSIRIVSTDSFPRTVKCFTSDGSEIRGITAIKINIEPDELVRAEINLCMSDRDIMMTAGIDLYTGDLDIMAHPLLSLGTLSESADALGYKLVKKEEQE